MGVMRALGRPSGSYLGSPRIVTAPRAPYRPAAGAPYRKGDLDIVELPSAVTVAQGAPALLRAADGVPAGARPARDRHEPRDGARLAAPPPRHRRAARAL